MSSYKERFRQILEAARTREGITGTDTMIVNSHLAQMKLFMLRQGLEFFPAQDTFGFRKMFLAGLIEENEIDSRLEGIVDDFLIDGKGLFYFRPVDESYRVMWFSKDNYRAYYDAAGLLEEVELIYSFTVRSGLGELSVPGSNEGSIRYVKLQVRKDHLKETISNEKPSFDAGITSMSYSPNRTRTLTNSLGFIPAVESFNTMRSTGMDATGDFDWLAEQIVVHDDLVKNIRTNIHFFGNPTLVSSRPKHDLIEAGDAEAIRPTISSQAGFASASRPSTRVSQPMGGGTGGMKIPRIIANIEPTDRAVFLTPDAVSGDQNLYARQYREEVRTALGGVDELGISAGATAYEIKSLYGRAATTAARRCKGLLTYGLCKLLGLIIFHEEQIFKESFGTAIGLEKPAPPMQEQFPDQQTFAAAVQEYAATENAYKAALDEKIREAVSSEQLPPGVVGLVPDGNRKIEWRWKGPVFEDSTEDILNASIVVRNLQELGVNSIEALRYLFPDKTDEERSAMLSGYPFRMAQATQQSIGTFLSLIENMRQVPHPQAPDLPMLADPKLDLTPYVYRALDFLKRELTYAGQYSDSSTAADPATLDSIERARSESGLPASATPERPTFIPDSFGATGSGAVADGGAPGLPAGSAGPGAGGEPMAGGVPAPVRKFDYEANLPNPGTLLGADPVSGSSTGLSLTGGNVPSGSIRFGDADFAAPSNRGLFPGDAATGPELEQRSKRTRERRVSRKRKSGKS